MHVSIGYAASMHSFVLTSPCCSCCVGSSFVLQAAQFEAEYQAVMREADEASGRDKSVLEAKAGKVKAKLDDALTKVSAIEVAPLPKVEVSNTACDACTCVQPIAVAAQAPVQAVLSSCCSHAACLPGLANFSCHIACMNSHCAELASAAGAAGPELTIETHGCFPALLHVVHAGGLL